MSNPSRLLVRGAVLGLALTLTLVGCGRDEREERAITNLGRGLEQAYPGFDPEDARCAAQKWVDQIGIEALVKAKALDDNLAVDAPVREATLTDDHAEVAARALTDCGDFRATVRTMVVSAFEADSGQGQCISEYVSTDAVRAWATSDLADDVTDDIYLVAGSACMSTEAQSLSATTALAEGFARSNELTQEQAACIARGIVEEIGAYELRRVGMLDADYALAPGVTGPPVLDRTNATAAAEVTMSCVTFEETLTQSMLKDGEAGQGPEVRACLTEAFGADEDYRAYLIRTYMGTQGSMPEDQAKQLADCFQVILEENPEAGAPSPTATPAPKTPTAKTPTPKTPSPKTPAPSTTTPAG